MEKYIEIMYGIVDGELVVYYPINRRLISLHSDYSSAEISNPSKRVFREGTRPTIARISSTTFMTSWSAIRECNKRDIKSLGYHQYDRVKSVAEAAEKRLLHVLSKIEGRNLEDLLGIRIKGKR